MREKSERTDTVLVHVWVFGTWQQTPRQQTALTSPFWLQLKCLCIRASNLDTWRHYHHCHSLHRQRPCERQEDLADLLEDKHTETSNLCGLSCRRSSPWCEFPICRGRPREGAPGPGLKGRSPCVQMSHQRREGEGRKTTGEDRTCIAARSMQFSMYCFVGFAGSTLKTNFTLKKNFTLAHQSAIVPPVHSMRNREHSCAKTITNHPANITANLGPGRPSASSRVVPPAEGSNAHVRLGGHIVGFLRFFYSVLVCISQGAFLPLC